MKIQTVRKGNPDERSSTVNRRLASGLAYHEVNTASGKNRSAAKGENFKRKGKPKRFTEPGLDSGSAVVITGSPVTSYYS